MKPINRQKGILVRNGGTYVTKAASLTITVWPSLEGLVDGTLEKRSGVGMNQGLTIAHLLWQSGPVQKPLGGGWYALDYLIVEITIGLVLVSSKEWFLCRLGETCIQWSFWDPIED